MMKGVCKVVFCINVPKCAVFIFMGLYHLDFFRVIGLQGYFPILQLTDIFLKLLSSIFLKYHCFKT